MSRVPARRFVTGLAAGLLGVSLAGCAAVAGVSDAPTGAAGGAVRSAQAQSIAGQVVGDSEKSVAAPGPEGDGLRASVYTGHALEAARADARLAPTLSQEARDARTLTGQTPVVLAVSRGTGYPRSILVQATRARSGLPVLYLLMTPDVRSLYRIAASAPMLPSASVKAFDAVTQGSSALGGGGGLVDQPEELVRRYAASLAFPAPGPVPDPPFAPDAFAAGVRAGATSQSQGLDGIATFTQRHEPKEVIGGLRVKGERGALVFAVLDRKDTLLNKAQGTLTPSAQFTALTGVSSVKAQAQLTTLEVVAFYVPEAGLPVVVGAEEHLYAASGT